MSPFVIIAFLAIVTLVTVAQAIGDMCSLDPVSLPWANVTLADGIAFNRGIEILLGGQPVSLRGTNMLSNLRIRNTRDCGFGNASIQSGCQGSSGSSFDITKSPTWEAAPQDGWNVTAVDAPQIGETVIDGWDTAKFDNLPEIYGFPFEVWSDTTSDNKSGLALGPNSSFVETLLQDELIPSRAWGLFFGSRSQTKGVDGNLTLGGYDRARLGGEWYNFTTQAGYVNNPCPLQVMVKDVRLNNVRGSFSLFADSDATVVACVDPLQNQFTFTQKMYDLFANLTDHPTNPAAEGGSNFTQQTYPLANAPLLGNLTVELSNGYTTLIPHFEFVSQERGTDAEGKYAVVNESRIMVAAGTTGTSTLDGVEIPILGGVYLSQNLLFVDYESGLFHLAPAVLGELGDHDHDIVKVCGPSGFDASMSSSASSTHQGSNSNAGAIAGGVVGGLAVIAIALLAFWYLRTKKKPRDREALPSGTDNGSAAHAPEVHQNQLPRVESWLEGAGTSSPQHRGSELAGSTAFPARTNSELEGTIGSPAIPILEMKEPNELVSPIIYEAGEVESPHVTRRESELEAHSASPTSPNVTRREPELEANPVSPNSPLNIWSQ